MDVFKEFIYAINRTFSTFCFGASLAQLLNGNYKLASWLLFSVSILFMIGYFTERWSK